MNPFSTEKLIPAKGELSTEQKKKIFAFIRSLQAEPDELQRAVGEKRGLGRGFA
jgi:hypothetical protein